MSIVLVNNFAVGDVNLTAMMKTLNLAYKGKSDITLSNYDNDTAPDVKVGSVFDCNGSIFEVTSSDETPSGYSGIANDTMFYLIYSVSLNEFIYTATAPTWSDSKQGWYDGNNRYFYVLAKSTLIPYGGKIPYTNIDGKYKALYSFEGLTGDYAFQSLKDYIPNNTDAVECASRQLLITCVRITRTSTTVISFDIGGSITEGSTTRQGSYRVFGVASFPYLD